MLRKELDAMDANETHVDGKSKEHQNDWHVHEDYYEEHYSWVRL